MRLRDLKIKDRGLFSEFLGLSRHELSVYAFENIFIWRNLFKIGWAVIEDSLCVFFQDKIGCFMYLPPLAEEFSPGVIKTVFRVMDQVNRNREISRIENVEEDSVSFYQDLGYCRSNKYADYLYSRSDLCGLKGNRFKSQRACYNHFVKNHKFEYLPFSPQYKHGCLKLYRRWMKIRQGQCGEALYCQMLKDSYAALGAMLSEYENLALTGRIVHIGRELKGFTFGFKLSPDTFCILYEVADLSLKGLSQFIFREFCRELEGYRYINIMDDSGLENLKRVKLSYRPLRIVPNYIIKRDNG